MKSHIRKLLVEGDRPGAGTLEYPPGPFSAPVALSEAGFRRPVDNKPPSTPFDSSMALTVIVLLTALFFMGFFSVYIRRFADDSAVEISRRRRSGDNPSPAASSSRSPTSSKGLEPSTVSSLPLFSYHGDAKETLDCPVCLTQFEDKDTVKIIPYCRHLFHPPCIDTWLSSRVSCPVCRSTQLFPIKGGGGESKVERSDTCLDVESLGVRRTTSCPSLGEPASLLRTSSL